MPLLLPSLTTLLLFFAATACCADDPVLHWSGGDNLPGKLVAADRETLSWQSPLFEQPMQIELSELASVTWPKQQRQPIAAGQMLFQMRNGDMLVGQLTAITEFDFQVQTQRHGTVRLLRDQIRLVRTQTHETQTNSPGLLYAGPSGLAGWKHPLISSWAEPPGWVEERGGRVSTSRADAVMFLPLQLSERFEVELILSSTECPSFVMSLGSNTETSIRLETWSESLVACSNADFQEVKKLPSDLRRLHLLLFVDNVAHRLVVSDEQGERLLELDTRNSEPGNDGLLIRNGAHNLTVEHITVAQWDGSNFTGNQASVSRIHLTDGTAFSGQLQPVPGDPDSVTIITKEQQLTIALNQIQGIIIHGQNEPERSISPLTASWLDGEVISGQCLQATATSITIQTPSSREPVVCSLSGIQRLRLPAQSVIPAATQDRLFYADGTLPGRLSIDGDGAQSVKWTVPGGRNAVTLSSEQAARIQRAARSANPSFDRHAFPDVIYLRNNDVLPCRISACTESSIQLSSPFFDQTAIDNSAVRAVELANSKSATGQHPGFADPNWRRIVGGPDIKPDAVTFRASEAIGHATILNGDVVEFKLTWTELISANILLNLFTQIPSNQPGGPAIAFSIRDNTITVMDGALDGARRATEEDREIKLPSMQAHVTIFRQGNKLRVSVNGQVAQTFDMESIDRTSRALLVRASVINRRRSAGIRPPAGIRTTETSPAAPTDTFVRMSEFEVRDTVGNSIRHFVDEEAKQITLTVPRFRRQTPATHALLSPNGDLLRGRLIAVDDSLVHFESQQQTLQFERQRVASIIWLTAPPADPAESQPAPAPGDLPSTAALSSSTAQTIQVMLDQGLVISLKPRDMDQTRLTGSSAVLGQCVVPSASVREVFAGQWANDQNFASYTAWDLQLAPDPEWQMPTADNQALQLVGEPAPDLSLPMLDGSPFRLIDNAGKILILDFWASWCGPCVQALPEYVNVTSKFDPEKVLFLAVNLKEKPQTVASFLAGRNLSPITLLDRNGIAAAVYGVSGIPHTVIIGPDGIVEVVKVGYNPNSATELHQIIRQMLNGTWQRPTADSVPIKPNMPVIER